MAEIDPLGRDALLVFLGGFFAVFLGIVLGTTGTRPSLPAVILGVALPLVVAWSWPRLRERVSLPPAWQPWREEGVAGRVAVTAALVGILGARLAFVALPERIQGQLLVALTVASVTGVAVGMGRICRRAFGG